MAEGLNLAKEDRQFVLLSSTYIAMNYLKSKWSILLILEKALCIKVSPSISIICFPWIFWL